MAQQPQARIAAIDSSARATLVGSRPAAAHSANDTGRMSPSAKLEGVTVVFSRSQAQEAALQALLTAQQTPGSPQYHQWLTPDQFGTQFGVADSDIAKVEGWLQQQGFTVSGVSRSRNRITFSGSVGQIETAFGTEMHRYSVNGESHFAPSSDLSVPAALVGSVQTVRNLSDFRPRSHVRLAPAQTVHGNFTSAQTQAHYLTPKDVDTIYDITPAYNAGYNGTGQSIAIVGQSAVVLTDISNFQTAAGLTVKAPATPILVPGTGTSTVYTGDEMESDLDLEYSGAIAPGATIQFVYVGSDTNTSVFDALAYAVDNRLAPIISSSYGDCEYDLGSTEYNSLNTTVLAQAAAQGETVISAAGDDGSTDCYADTNQPTTQRTALGVDFPGSSQYVTSLGGTEFSPADVASTNTTYWTAAAGTDVISSALSYMPDEGVWNDDAQGGGLSSGGGGVSLYTPQPTWQTNVAGISAGSNRMVPDVALSASPYDAPYLFCSSDSQTTGISGSCANGFRDSNNEYLTTAGGTSFAAPIFAGMVAVINQSRSFTAGQGVINTTLYGLASNAANYAAAFHDITSGNNNCSTAGSIYCAGAGETEYTAGIGYDEASGLGSVDLYHMLTLWPDVAGSYALASTTTVIAANATVAPSTNDLVTITVAPVTGDTITTTPTGTVTLMVGTTAVAPITLSANGTATYTFSEATAGQYEITAAYSGDANYATSTGSYEVTVAGTTAPSTTPGFALTATNVTVAAGSTGTSTVTITPANGYTGTVDWSAVTAVPTLLDGCYSIANTAVSGTAAVTATLTVYTDSSQCTTATTTTTSSAATTSSTATANVRRKFATRAPAAGVSALTPEKAPFGPVPIGVAFAGLLAVGFIGRRSRGVRLLMVAGLFAVLGLGMSGCGSSSSSTASGTAATAGVYDITLTGTDSANAAITASIPTATPIVLTVTSTTATASVMTTAAKN